MMFFYPFCLAFSSFYYIFTQFIVVLECSTHVSQCKYIDISQYIQVKT